MAHCLIVGIGCSAGGLDPLQQLFSRMQTRSGMAFVVAAHLDPTQESHLVDLIGRRTELSVVQVEDSMPVEPDHVYVIAPDQELTI
jgi:two-component system CheB/CheR fusion protein